MRTGEEYKRVFDDVHKTKDFFKLIKKLTIENNVGEILQENLGIITERIEGVEMKLQDIRQEIAIYTGHLREVRFCME
jgi:hypothetical protein